MLLCSNVDSDRYLFIMIHNRLISSQTYNLLEELKSRTEDLLFFCKRTCCSSLLLASGQTQRCFVSTSLYLCLSLSVRQSRLVPLRSLVGLRPPSTILSFSHSVLVSLLHLYLTLSKTQLRRRSLSMLVLSHSDTHTTSMGT